MKGIAEYIKDRGHDSTIWALWAWNGVITEEEIRLQLGKLGETGVDGVIIRPSSDMFPLYLSDEFWKLFDVLLSIARERGVSVMLGDDFSRPGESPFLADVSGKQHLRAARLAVEEEHNLEEGDTFNFTPSPVRKQYVVAVQRNKRKIYLSDAQTLFDGEGSEHVEWAVPEGHWKVVVFEVTYDASCDGEYLPNFFSMKAGQTYVNVVLDEFAQRYLPTYEDVFRGVFCEVPALLPSKAGVPWDDDLLISKYRSRYKRNLIETMPALFYEVADNEIKYRPHVYSFLQDTLYDRFPAVVDKWVKQNSLSLWVAGPEGDRAGGSQYLPDLFSHPKGDFDVIGTCRRGSRRVNDISLLSLLARARMENKPVFSILGRSVRMDGASIGELKQEALFFAVNGVSHIIIDGIKFNRNYRYEEVSPQVLSFGSPDFFTMKDLVTLTRSNLNFSAQCERYGDSVAVVFPSSSIMSDYNPDSPTAIKTAYRNIMESIACLQELGINFEVVDEQMLLDCEITKDGVLLHKDDEYSSITGVIFPYARLINNSFFVKVEQMSKKKIALFFVDAPPEGSFDDGHSPSFIKRVHKLVRAKTKRVDYGSCEKLREMFAEDSFRGEIKTKGITNPAVLWKKNVEINGVDGYWLFNAGTEDSTLRLFPYENTEDDENGDRYIAYDITTGNTLRIDLESHNRDLFTLFPGQSLFMSYDEESREETPITNKYRIKLKEDRWKFDTDSLNSFPLSRWSSKIGINRNAGSLTYYSEGHFVSHEFGYEAYLVFLDSIPHDKGTLNKRFRVSLNGRELLPMKKRIPEQDGKAAFFDDSSTLLIYDMSEAVVKGNNRVLILSNGEPDLPDPVKYPPFVAVDNPVDKSGKVWTVIGKRKNDVYEWGGFGYPFLLGTGVYSMTFEVPNLFESIYLNFTKLSGSAEVILNGVSYGVLQWSPYRLNITEQIKLKERNELVVKVQNTLDVINHLSAEKSGILGPVYLDIYGDKSSEKSLEEDEEVVRDDFDE
ncbi:hypothetical protein [Chitinivibrio alkaliphilus]|uniref:Uncharacterized protein n=1 Tax=Chitinivibrio alkaliphilus ACht1 TaxID=1313304 RepID=U7D985_9BACT|nr:hypothetical protein [Chitinivibrio alkaliphilus]ERP31657.1 hypothetical protein CALK_1521 [Chitinivibrio alkaliphilus ACht1]